MANVGQVCVNCIKNNLTVFLGGAGMVGAYNQDMIDALEENGINNAHYGNFSSLPKGMDKNILPFLDNLADANAVVFYNQSPDDPIVVEYGELCKKSSSAQVVEENNIFGVKIKKFDRVAYECESSSLFAIKISRNINFIKKASFSLSDLEINQDVPNGMFNLIGYSWGSIIAARSALYYAEHQTKIDNLVLIGSPINKSLLMAVRENPLIKKVWVINLTIHGDPIYAGISDEELVNVAPLLATQMLDGVGHFYYSGDNQEGKKRRRNLAKQLYGYGLR